MSLGRPVVYLGPSAPVEEIRAILPDALIRPPAARGDLYRDRMLRFSVFLLIDGVFSQEEALSPREVIDVIADGGRLFGASSMGALRAADCAPAGALGVGTVYRLFRHRVLDSEDEVAVQFLPEAPFPALTESLVNIRLALRRARRAGSLAADEAATLLEAARALHYGERGWRRIFAAADLGHRLPALRPVLSATDVKRADALAAARRVAARRKADPDWSITPRKGRGGFGLLGEGRERPVDARRGRDMALFLPAFTRWMLASGRINPWLTKDISALALLGQFMLDNHGARERVTNAIVLSAENISGEVVRRLVAAGEFDAECYRFDAIAMAAGLTGEPDTSDLRLAGDRIAAAHGLAGWAEVLAAAGPGAEACRQTRQDMARGIAARRRIHGRKPQAWTRTR